MGFFVFLSRSGGFNCPYEKALYAQKPCPSGLRHFFEMPTSQEVANPLIIN